MARTGDVWEEIGGTYLQTVWAEGRDILVNGLNHYVNFNAVSGASGYGIRDNAGSMEFKNSGGSWVGIGSGSGAVTSVNSLTGAVPLTGTSNRLTVSASNVFDIAATYVGQTSIATLGTVSTGTWQATTVAVGFGGTGTTTVFTAGSVVFAGASGVYSQNNSNFFWDNTNTRLGIGLAGASPGQALDIGAPMQFTGVPVASAATAALAGAGAGNLTNGAYTYRVSFVTAVGETIPTNTSNSITVVDKTTNGQIALTNIPTSTSPFVIGRNIYRTDPTIPNGIFYRISSGTTITNNTATTYTDNIINSFVSNLNYGNVTGDSSAAAVFITGQLFIHFRGNKNLWIGSPGNPAGNTTSANLSAFNVGIGSGVMASITTGGSNVAIGANGTGGQITSGALLTLVGSHVGNNITTQTEITAYGQSSGGVTTGNYGTFVGSYSGNNLVGGDFNSTFGRGCFSNATSGANNTAFGSGAGGAGSNQSNWNNMAFFGYNVGANLNANNLSNITIIGGNSLYAQAAGASNTLNIMNMIYGATMDGTTSTVSTGNLGIGIIVPLSRLHIQGSVSGTVVQIVEGAASQSGDLSQWQNSSASVLTSIGSTGLINKYNSVATMAWGVPAIYGSGRSVAQSGAVSSVAAYTVGASDGTFEISANVLITTSTLHSFTVTCTYTDEGNTSRSLTLNFSQLSGTFVTSLTNALGASAYEGVPLHIRAKASTAITIATAGTFTTVTYNVEGIIKQMA